MKTQERRATFGKAFGAAMRHGAAKCDVDTVYALFDAEGPAAVAEKEGNASVAAEQMKERAHFAADLLRSTKHGEDADGIRKAATAVVAEFLEGVGGVVPEKTQAAPPDKPRGKR